MNLIALLILLLHKKKRLPFVVIKWIAFHAICLINEFLILYEKALRDEIELHFVSDGQIINSRISAAEKFQFGISLGLAKYYSDAISDNVKRAMEAKAPQRRMACKASLWL